MSVWWVGLAAPSLGGEPPHEPAHGERDTALSAPEPRVGPGWGLSWRRTPLSHTHSGFSLKRRCRRGRARNADKLPSREGSSTGASAGQGVGAPVSVALSLGWASIRLSQSAGVQGYTPRFTDPGLFQFLPSSSRFYGMSVSSFEMAAG